MRSSLVIAATLAAGAVASPLGNLANLFKREYVTEYSYVTTTVLVYADALPTDAPVPASSKSWHWHGGKGRGRHGKNRGGAAAVTTYTSVVQQETPAPAPEQPTQQESEPEEAEPAPAPASTPPPAAPPAVAVSQPEPEPAPATPPQQSSPSTGNSYSDQVIRHHNVHRANHSAPDVRWSQSLADTARRIAQKCVYAHDTATDGGGYGQNIAAGAGPEDIGSVITDLFYNSEVRAFEPYYGQPTPKIPGNFEAGFDGFGHFTQIVWKETSEVGCATFDCSGAGKGPKGLGNVGSSVPPFFTVCNYKGPGNFLGEFDKNVAKPLGYNTVGSSY